MLSFDLCVGYPLRAEILMCLLLLCYIFSGGFSSGTFSHILKKFLIKTANALNYAANPLDQQNKYHMEPTQLQFFKLMKTFLTVMGKIMSLIGKPWIFQIMY